MRHNLYIISCIFHKLVLFTYISQVLFHPQPAPVECTSYISHHIFYYGALIRPPYIQVIGIHLEYQIEYQYRKDDLNHRMGVFHSKTGDCFPTYFFFSGPSYMYF